MTTTAVAQPAGIARTAAGTRGQANVLGLPFVIITLSTALALTLVLSAVAAFSKGAVAALVCLTGVATVAVLLMTVLARRNFDIFEPYSFIILAALVGTALKAPYAALFDNDAIRRDLLLGQPLDVLLKGSIFMLIGLVALSAGYMVRVPPIRISGLRLVRRQYWERRVLTPVLAATLALSIISFFVWFRMMGVSITSLVELSQKRFYIVEGSEFQSSLGYLNWGVSVAESTFYVLLTWWLLSKKSLPLFARIGLPLTGLIALFFPILTSSRTGMVE
ncbi:MAG TPA: hypothetical protein VK928_13510, partial [Longimicrobiales bacterium]|nr:hypothetical protein [Longimicrobiales bacterium]